MRGEEDMMAIMESYGAAVTYQNADGAYSAYVSQRENRGIIRVPFAVQANGQTRSLQSVRAYDGYTAKAELTVSDVEVFGDVTLTADDAHMTKAPGAFWPSALPVSYGLMADGQSEPLRNLDGALEEVDAHTLRVGVRFDLPQTLEGLALRPEMIAPAEQPEDALDIRLTDKP